MKRILVLGGNGFLGKYIVERLSNDNEVIVADYNIEHTNEKPQIKYRKINFIECEDFDDYLKDVDMVIHLISTITANDRTDNIKKEIEDNVFPTIKLLDSMVKNNVKDIMFVSSGGTVYGNHDLNPILEDEPKKPICNYGIIKNLIENYLYLYKQYYGINYKTVRLANPYSEVVKSGKKQGIIPILIDNIIEGNKITIWGDGNDVRDYIYIDDAVEAIMKVFNYVGSETVFNVGTGKGLTINDLLELIKDKLGVKGIDIVYQESRKCDVNNNILDVNKIKNETDWEPKVNIEEGIQRIINKKGVLINERRK